MATLSLVSSCATTACSFNDGGCNAFAITVGGTGSAASCTTFTDLDARAGSVSDSGRVAVCQRLECVHNENLLCGAQKIEIGADTANCLSYEAS